PARSAATAVPDAAPLWVGTGRDQAREPSAEAGHVECRGAADAPGAGPRPREETGGRREAAVPEGPPRVVRRRGPGTPRETGRPAGKGEGAHRIEAEAPDLRPYGRRGGVARLDETRVADGDAPTDRVADGKQGKRTDRRAQGIDEAAQGVAGTEVGSGQDRERGPRPRWRHHGT